MLFVEGAIGRICLAVYSYQGGGVYLLDLKGHILMLFAGERPHRLGTLESTRFERFLTKPTA